MVDFKTSNMSSNKFLCINIFENMIVMKRKKKLNVDLKTGNIFMQVQYLFVALE